MRALHTIELATHVPAAAMPGEHVACEWTLTNPGLVAIAASFYVRSAPARLVALVCRGGRALGGRHHGSAAVVIEPGTTATVSALLDARTPVDHRVRVAVVTRSETLERTDTVAVRSGSGHDGAPPPSASSTISS
jgi:hypothetical protein